MEWQNDNIGTGTQVGATAGVPTAAPAIRPASCQLSHLSSVVLLSLFIKVLTVQAISCARRLFFVFVLNSKGQYLNFHKRHKNDQNPVLPVPTWGLMWENCNFKEENIYILKYVIVLIDKFKN